MRKLKNCCHQDVTIFIPTHNRKELLMRNLRWLQASPYMVFIADSSDPENNSQEEIKILNKQKENSWIHYFHSPGQNIYDKLVAGINRISTKYVVMCPDDDFILWQNIRHFYDVAEANCATTVCGRDLQYFKDKDRHTISESSRYRKFCIRHNESKIDHLFAGMNPIVCTYWQFYQTKNIQDIWKYLNEQKVNMPGTKFTEILFRSACFISGPVYFCDKILRVIGDSKSLRYYDRSKASQEYVLDFSDELEIMEKNNLLEPYIIGHSQYLARHFTCSLEMAREIVDNHILKPMYLRMRTRHELMWDQFYCLAFSKSITKDRVRRKDPPRGLTFIFSLRDTSFRLPFWSENLDDYLLKDEWQWNVVLEFILFLDSF